MQPPAGASPPWLRPKVRVRNHKRPNPAESTKGSKRQPAFFRWRGSVGIADPGRGWSLEVRGENLTDEAVSLYQTDAFPDYFASLPDSSRRIVAQLRLGF